MAAHTRLHQLALTNFRKYASLDLSFDQEGITCFIGPNTVGKTNILEAIYILSLLKSFRTSDLKDCILWGQEYTMISCKTEIGENTLELAVNMLGGQRLQKSFKKDDIFVQTTEYIGAMPVVFFSPDDINILLHSPKERRRYMDILLSQADKEYLADLVLFKKIIKTRNALLKAINRESSPSSELQYWDLELAAVAIRMSRKRHALFDTLKSPLRETYQEIAQTDDLLNIEYKSQIKADWTVEEYLHQLNKRQQRDIFLEATSLGPHRDDFFFYVNEKSIDTYASRGDTRSIILALKLSEIEYISQHLGTLPLLLLDDVFSELDMERKQMLLDVIPEGVQTFITSTDALSVDRPITYIKVDTLFEEASIE